LVVRYAPRHQAGEHDFFPFGILYHISVCPDNLCPQLVIMHAARSDPPTPQARAVGRGAQQPEQERAALAKEKDQAV
jgi:hypothetical protein